MILANDNEEGRRVVLHWNALPALLVSAVNDDDNPDDDMGCSAAESPYDPAAPAAVAADQPAAHRTEGPARQRANRRAVAADSEGYFDDDGSYVPPRAMPTPPPQAPSPPPDVMAETRWVKMVFLAILVGTIAAGITTAVWF